MNNSSNISIIIGFIMLTLTLVNAITINDLSPAIIRSEVLSALTSIIILLIGFLQQRPEHKQNGKLIASDKRLRLACFKTGYVRNQNSCSSNYQLNKQYKQNVRWTMLDGNKLYTYKTVMIARERIYSGIARLNYMLEFYKRNHLNK